MKDLKDFRSKIKSPKELVKILEKLRRSGKKIVYCHGVFDIFHSGHLYHLEQAKRLGDILVVSLTADRHVGKGPGRPVFKESDRMAIIASLGPVDFVTLSDAPYPLGIMKVIKPDFYVKGKDSSVKPGEGLRQEIKLMSELRGQVVFTDSLPVHSTQLIKLVVDNGENK